MESNKDNINLSVVNLNSYTKPVTKEVKGADWVKYGADNEFFEYLIEIYNDSTTNNAIINGMINQIYGKGLIVTNAKDFPLDSELFEKILKKDDLKRIINDIKLLGNAAIQIIYNSDKSKIDKIKHFPTENIRAGKTNDDGDIDKFYYSPDWSKVKRNTELKPIPAFGKGKRADKVEIYYMKPYKSGSFYYSEPDYQGCIQYCELESEISNFHINNVLNGFTPSALINFNNGQISDMDVKRTIERKITEKFTGSSNAGKFILSFNDNKENAATIETLDMADAHNQFEFISKEAQEKIMVGHKITSPMLLGIKDNTGLGNNAEELKTASILFDATTIAPFRELIIDTLEEILEFNNMTLNFEFLSLNPFADEIVVETEADVIEEEEKNNL